MMTNTMTASADLIAANATAIVVLPDGELAAAFACDVGRNVETKVVQEYKHFGFGPWIFRGTDLRLATRAQQDEYADACEAIGR